jgi:hypothetical protein
MPRNAGVKVPSTAAPRIKRTRAATSREQALLTTEAGSARPTIYASDHATGSSTCSQRFLTRHFSGDLTATLHTAGWVRRAGGKTVFAALGDTTGKGGTRVGKVMIDRSYG